MTHHCTVYLYDELPRFGCGWRPVEVLSKGPKWVRLRYAPKTMVGVTTSISATGRLRRSDWERMTKKDCAA